MNILHILDEPYDSGIVQYALKTAFGLRRRGHTSRVWGLEGCYPVEEAERLGLPARGYSHPWLNLGTLRNRLREDRIELLVAHTGSAHILGVAIAGWRDGGSVAVIRTRGDARRMKPRPGRRLLWRSTAGFVAANKKILADHQRHYGTLEISRAMIYEGAPDPGPVKPPMTGAPTIGIVGRLDPVKGHSVLLAAAVRVLKTHRDARVMIIGRQENVSSGDLLREAHRLGIGDSVELTGHVPDVYHYMRRCHIGVVASVASEAVSRAAVEWMAVGRPLVVTSVGCLPEYVEDGKSGYIVPPRDPEALGAALGRLVGDCYLRETIGRASRARYESIFTLDRFLDETENFYESTLYPVPS